MVRIAELENDHRPIRKYEHREDMPPSSEKKEYYRLYYLRFRKEQEGHLARGVKQRMKPHKEKKHRSPMFDLIALEEAMKEELEE